MSKKILTKKIRDFDKKNKYKVKIFCRPYVRSVATRERKDNIIDNFLTFWFVFFFVYIFWDFRFFLSANFGGSYLHNQSSIWPGISTIRKVSSRCTSKKKIRLFGRVPPLKSNSQNQSPRQGRRPKIIKFSVFRLLKMVSNSHVFPRCPSRFGPTIVCFWLGFVYIWSRFGPV